jgi:hypothetical protein
MADNELLVVNLTQPTLQTIKLDVGDGHMTVDVQKLKDAADELGANKYDVLSIGGYRNAKGEFVPDYDTVRIEKRHE